MDRRLQLQTILEQILGTENEPLDKKRVYFQPPPNWLMEYPCIVYERSTGDTQFADNRPYKFTMRYSVTLIDEDPDSEYLEKIANLPMCTYDRHFTSDNLNHDVFNLYY